LSRAEYPSAVNSLRVLAAGLVVLAVLGCGGSAATARPSGSTLVVGSGSPPPVVPIIVNSQFGPGPNRFLFLFVDGQNNPVSSPDRRAQVAFTPPGGQAAAPKPAAFLWGIENVRGYYVVDTDFDKAGDWKATFTTTAPGSSEASLDLPFQVVPDPSAVAIGEKAPSVKTPTLDDVGGDVSKLSSDTKPDATFYKVSEDAALAAYKPFALVFATPKFCTSQLCGPQLDTVKAIAKAYPSVTFINVEPYKLEVKDGQLQPVLNAGNLVPVPAVDAFGILSEPWLFVVDKEGVVRGSFEGVFSESELRAALDKVK
jgi:hypothetical protein